MLAVTAALATIAILGLAFRATKQLGILACAGLCLIHPIPVLSLLLVGGCVFYFFKIRNR